MFLVAGEIDRACVTPPGQLLTLHIGTDLHGLQFERQRPSQAIVSIGEQFLVRLQKFLFHPVEVLDAQAKDLGFFEGHNSELSLQEVFVADPVV